MAVQERNAEMVNLLKADFIHKQDTVYLAGIVAGNILMLPGLVAFWPMSVSLDDDNTLYADAAIVAGNLQASSLGEPWINVTFNTGWGSFGGIFSATQYKKVGDFVFLQGLVIRTSGVATVIFTLPVGYRPVQPRVISASSNDAFARIEIGTNGDVVIVVGDPAVWISLDDIAFSTL